MRHRFLICALALILAAPVAGQQRDTSIYEARDLDEIPERYREWVTAGVGHLITEEEYDVFLRLDIDAKYDIFIEQFWKNRDPTPGTPRNEYYELHYERLAYVNKFFGRGTSLDGWQTDRGRIWILLGEPISRNRYQSEMVTYPAEIWMYAGETELGLPPFFYMVFYQRYGSGDFRLYSPLADGPEKLLNGAGIREVEQRAQQDSYRFDTYAPTGYGDSTALYSLLREIDYDLASAAFSLFPSEAGLEYGITPLRSEMLIGDVAAVPERIMPDKTWAYRVLTGVTESDVRFETLRMSAYATALIDTDGEPFLHIATSASGEHLNIDEYEDHYYFSFGASGAVTLPDSKVLLNFDASLSGELDEEQARRFSRQQLVYLDMFPTVPGRQLLTVMIENEVARSFGQQVIDLDVPSIHPSRPRLIGPVVVADTRDVPDWDPYATRYAFQYANVLMVPIVDQAFAGPPLRVFQQVLLPEGFAVPLTGRFVVRDPSGATVREGSQTLSPEDADVYGVLPHVWQIDTRGLGAGRYMVEVSLDGDGQAARRREIQLVVPKEDQALPFVNSQHAPPPTDVTVALERARQYRVLGEYERAIGYLGEALDREPDNGDIVRLQMLLLRDAGRWQDLIGLLTPEVVEDPRNVEAMLALAGAHSEAGEHYDAIRYYERSRMVNGADEPPVLNALASAYFADGKSGKARELWQRSLELDIDQPEIRRLLEQISDPVGEPQQ